MAKANQSVEPFRPMLDLKLLQDVSAPPSRGPANIENKNVGLQSQATRSEIVGSLPAAQISPPTNNPSTFSSPELSTTEPLDQERRFLFSRSEAHGLDRLITNLAGRLDAQLKASHVIRALVLLLLNAEAAIDRRAGDAVSVARPPNGDLRGIKKFERSIASIIAAGLRDAGPLRD